MTQPEGERKGKRCNKRWIATLGSLTRRDSGAPFGSAILRFEEGAMGVAWKGRKATERRGLEKPNLVMRHLRRGLPLKDALMPGASYEGCVPCGPNN